MKKYYLREQTPLAFHKFVWYFSLPAGVLLELYYLSNTIKTMPFFHWLFAVDICYYVISLLLRVITFIGFLSWQGYAWKNFMAMLALGGAYNVYAVIICGIYSPQDMASAFVSLLTWCIYASLAGLYYLKRKPLFFPGQIVADASFVAAGENAAPGNPAAGTVLDVDAAGNKLPADAGQEAAATSSGALATDVGHTVTGGILPPVQYCRRCGYKLLEGSTFCSRCGAKIDDKE